MGKKQKKKKPYIMFITPGLLVYTVFIVFPIIFVLYLCFFDWSGLGSMTFIGLDNFKTLFTNPRIAPTFWNALGNNLKYLLCVWFIITPVQFLMAYLFYLKIPFYKYYKLMIFMPYVISSTIVSFFATMIFNPNIGFLNEILTKIGLINLTSSWLGDPNLAFKIMIIVIIWQGSGSGMMIFYANMMDIPVDIIEASRIDGCSEAQRFWNILLPLSLPSCASIIVMSSIWALGIFDIPFILGGSSGGVSNCLDFVTMVFYRYTFGNVLNGKSELGFGAAISAAMFIAIFIVTVVQNKVLSKFEYDN
ncbi:carbohydrate ABC transporter permease [Anaerocolumna sp. MB42-C2]|uniref:carbohydrate ABC transporter permease n=1 Tax=Anaerocolumna sp. MB42-C2 TaxID=3070997 RepID=UPI0027E1429A|nr:sugar ABC transporter permease [Anaerocolumna sp. MB42-C2]WMJ89946.1 sugar ABC transporter permease [Anaerocolumna sp. MB42-C2]